MSDADNGLPPSGTELGRAFDALVSTFNERGIRYAIIGGIATLQHTRVRTTDDIDALLAVPQLAMPALFESLGGRGFAVDVVRNVREFSADGLTVVRFGDVLVDLMRPLLPAYAHVLDRAIETQILGRTVRVSSAEGLIVMKLIADRPQDRADVQELLAVYEANIDADFVRAELDTVMKADDPRREQFETWLRGARRGG